jgi:hypothetical protein
MGLLYIFNEATTDVKGRPHSHTHTHMQRNTGDGDNRVSVLWVYSGDSLVENKIQSQKKKSKGSAVYLNV